MSAKHMFQPGWIGPLRIKNRLIMPAMATNFASAHGEPTARMAAYYEARARGGVGLIVVENASIDEPTGGNGAVQLRIHHDRHIPGLSSLARRLQEAGGAVAIQLNHAGAIANPKRTGIHAMGPSDVGWMSASPRPTVLTLEEIERVIACYADAAVRAKRAGFDAVEIHGAHGYLIAQFLSPITNHRVDAYGGSTEKRWRFALDVVRSAREAVGAEFPLLFRLSGDEFMPGGRTLEESVELSQSLVEAGIDALHVSAGTSANPEVQLEPISYPEGWRAYLAETIKSKLTVPVITVGVFRQPETVERALAEGQADFVAIGRGLIADPEWPNKAHAGAPDDIRHCISCNRCVRQRVFDDLPIRCSVNPVVGFESETSRISHVRRRIVVVGGGPAGLQAATTASQLGAEVTLLEREAVLGGRLRAAALPPTKDKITWLTEDLVRALPASIDIRLGVPVELDDIRALHPDVAIIATGGISATLDIPIDPHASVQTAESMLQSETDLNAASVVVIGAGMVGCETALACARRGARVFLLEALPDIAGDCEPISRAVLLKHLDQEDAHILSNVRVLEIASDNVQVEQSGVETCLPATHVVTAIGTRPDDQWINSLLSEEFAVLVVGDAYRPRGIAEAVYEGWRAGQRAVVHGTPHTSAFEEEPCNESYE